MKTTSATNGLNSTSLEPFKRRDWLILVLIFSWKRCPGVTRPPPPTSMNPNALHPSTHTHTHTHTHTPLALFQQCIIQFCVCMRPVSRLSLACCGTRKLWHRGRCNGWQEEDIIPSHKSSPPPQRPQLPQTPSNPPTPVPPRSTGWATDGGASSRTASFAKLIVYYNFHCCF